MAEKSTETETAEAIASGCMTTVFAFGLYALIALVIGIEFPGVFSFLQWWLIVTGAYTLASRH